MTVFAIPLIFTIAGLVLAFMAYSGIRRGGARFYTLEREAVLRRASFSLIGSVLLFLTAVSLLIYQEQQRLIAEEAATAEAETVEATPTLPLPVLSSDVTPTTTLEAATPTPTVVICRGVIEGTGESGLLLRDTPGGEEMETLPEGTVVNLLPDEPQEANGLVWRKIRTVFGEEGWVAQDFLTVSATCSQ